MIFLSWPGNAFGFPWRKNVPPEPAPPVTQTQINSWKTDVTIEGEGCDTGERDALDLQLELI